mmetsp:Transcript_21097/g.51508  ORF Transcript_21097/g.51508 Transcript_21097/m.51508 type:complete len:91 (-) Transcript_21097:593-865(-)
MGIVGRARKWWYLYSVSIGTYMMRPAESLVVNAVIFAMLAWIVRALLLPGVRAIVEVVPLGALARLVGRKIQHLTGTELGREYVIPPNPL